MKITKYGSATILIETRGISVLCDPWLTDGAYYGAWFNYPPIDLDECNFQQLDYVYISHIHPDHFDPKTMELIDKSTPVLIHSYHQKFLKANIERLGFRVIELENGEAYPLAGDVKLSIYAADDCDPSICGHMFGCVTSEMKGSLQIDSICVLEDGDFTLVNTNDCPYDIASKALGKIKRRHPQIDFALVGYTSASLFPHCMIDYSSVQMRVGREKAKMKGLITGLNSLRILKPKFYMPFAGNYILGGQYHYKNKNLPKPEIQEAVDFFQQDSEIQKNGSQAVLLNFKESFDLIHHQASAVYEIIDIEARETYIQNVIRHHKYIFEDNTIPSEEELLELFEQAIPRLRRKQIELSFFEDLNLIFDIGEARFICLNLADVKLHITDRFDYMDNYHRFKLDPRLLKLALQGPRFANWNNIEIGALLDFARKPDVFRMDVHTLINALHI